MDLNDYKYESNRGVASEKKESLTFIKKIIEVGKYKPVIDKIYSLDQIAEAHSYVDKGHKKGNVILTVQKMNDV